MNTAIAAPLTAADRCDRCGTKAYVRARLHAGGELLFCAHHGREHLGDDIAGLADDHRVTDQHTLALDFGRVVQGGQPDGGPGDLDRLHVGERGDPSGASDIDPDIEEFGGDLFRRVLVGDRPARCARGGAEAALQRHVVDLDHQAVDLVFDVVAVLTPVGDAFGDRRDTADPGGVGGHRQPPGAQRPVGIVQRGRAEPLGLAQTVTDHPQPPPRGHRRILLAQRSGGAVARIGERRLSLGYQTGVEFLEIGDPEEHLTAHLQHRGHREFVCAGEPFGNIVDGAGIQGDIFTAAAVAAGGGAHQHTVAVNQRQRDTVDLELGEEDDLAPDVLLHARDPVAQLPLVEDVVQRHHPLEVIDRGELRGESAAHQLGGRIGHRELRERGLHLLQATQQRAMGRNSSRSWGMAPPQAVQEP